MATTKKPSIYALRYEDPQKIEDCIKKYGWDGVDPDLVIDEREAGDDKTKARIAARRLAKKTNGFVELLERDIETDYIAEDDVTLYSISDHRVIYDASY